MDAVLSFPTNTPTSRPSARRNAKTAAPIVLWTAALMVEVYIPPALANDCAIVGKQNEAHAPGTASQGEVSMTVDACLTPTFDMSDQVALEKQAMRIFKMPQFQQQKKNVEEKYRQHWIAKTPDGEKGLDNVVNTIAFASVQFALVDDTNQPRM